MKYTGKTVMVYQTPTEKEGYATIDEEPERLVKEDDGSLSFFVAVKFSGDTCIYYRWVNTNNIVGSVRRVC